MKEKHSHTHGKADYIGIGGSILCIIHCLITPLLVVSTSIWATDELIEGMHMLNYVFILINGVAVYFATRHTHAAWVNKLLWFAFAVFAVSLLLEEFNEVFHYVSYVGSALLIAGHISNLYMCRTGHSH